MLLGLHYFYSSSSEREPGRQQRSITTGSEVRSQSVGQDRVLNSCSTQWTLLHPSRAPLAHALMPARQENDASRRVQTDAAQPPLLQQLQGSDPHTVAAGHHGQQLIGAQGLEVCIGWEAEFLLGPVSYLHRWRVGLCCRPRPPYGRRRLVRGLLPCAVITDTNLTQTGC